MKNVTPDQVRAWVTTVAGLTQAGLQVAHLIQGWVGQAQPTLTSEEKQAVYDAIMADDAVRAAFSRKAAGG